MDLSIPRRVAWAALMLTIAALAALTMDANLFAGVTYTGAG
jgi:hypothetical protein